MYSFFKNKISEFVSYKIDKNNKRYDIKIDDNNKKFDIIIEGLINRLNLEEKKNNRLVQQLKNEQMAMLTLGGIWFYTLPKTGSTYLRNFLTNYINILLNDSTLPLGKNEGKKFHNFNSQNLNNPDILYGQRFIWSKTKYSTFVHTHMKIKSYAEKNIFILRNPLDYTVSRYFWDYKNGSSTELIGDVWKDIINHFIEYYHDKTYLNSHHNSIYLCYEDMISGDQPFVDLIDFLGLDYSETAFKLALKFSSKDSVKQEERKINDLFVGNTGHGLVYGKNGRDSFIRSGQIGEWKNHIDDDLKAKILSYLEDNGVDIKEFQYE